MIHWTTLRFDEMKNRKQRAFSFIIIMIFLSLISVAFFVGYQFLMFAISGILLLVILQEPLVICYCNM